MRIRVVARRYHSDLAAISRYSWGGRVGAQRNTPGNSALNATQPTSSCGGALTERLRVRLASAATGRSCMHVGMDHRHCESDAQPTTCPNQRWLPAESPVMG